jgi:hypothetical protein
MTQPVRAVIGVCLAALLAVVGLLLLHKGVYGFTIFVLAPFLIGALASWVIRPRTARGAAWLGALAASLAACSLLAIGIEGAICIVMSLPLVAPLGVLGALAVYGAQFSPRASRSGVAFLLLMPPASFTWDTHARPDVFPVHTAIVIAAPPERVWRNVVSFSELPPPQEWYFQGGIAYPKRARIEGVGAGATRYCEFSTGPFVEPIEVWDEPRLLQFRVTENPAPLHEWSPYAQVLPKHLHGYLISRRGQFRLTPLPGNRTLLEGTTWYQHGLWPAQYWRWWSEAIIHRIHLRVLNHIRNLSEASATP